LKVQFASFSLEGKPECEHFDSPSGATKGVIIEKQIGNNGVLTWSLDLGGGPPEDVTRMISADESLVSSAPEHVANAGSIVADLILTDRSNISSKKTPGGIDRHLDPILARESASSLLSRPMWAT
jgi:hypothetical protein